MSLTIPNLILLLLLILFNPMRLLHVGKQISRHLLHFRGKTKSEQVFVFDFIIFWQFFQFTTAKRCHKVSDSECLQMANDDKIDSCYFHSFIIFFFLIFYAATFTWCVNVKVMALECVCLWIFTLAEPIMLGGFPYQNIQVKYGLRFKKAYGWKDFLGALPGISIL